MTSLHEEILPALEASEVFLSCPLVIQELIRGLVQDLCNEDWDNWSADIEMDFVENLLLSVLKLPA